MSDDPCIELRRRLRILRELRLRKKLGQHLMRECKIGMDFMKVISELSPRAVVEVGAGPGTLTLFLVRVCNKVLSIEIDSSFKQYLAELTRNYLLEAVFGDAMHLIPHITGVDVLASNTPYNISSQLLVMFVKNASLRAAVVTLQKDLVDRLLAPPGSRRYGRIAAFLRTFTVIERVADYPPNFFVPEPEVWSSLVVIKKTVRWGVEWGRYEEMLRCLFNQRRRLLRSVARRCGVAVPDELVNKRVYEVSPEEFIKIYKLNYSGGP